MWKDPIVEEVRRVRDAHAKKFDYDIWAIYEDIKRFVQESGLETVSLPPKPARSTPAPDMEESEEPENHTRTVYEVSTTKLTHAFREGDSTIEPPPSETEQASGEEPAEE